jgi:hypothetical protein
MTKEEALNDVKKRTHEALMAVRETLKEKSLYFGDVVLLRNAFDNSTDYQERMELLGLIRIHDSLTDIHNLYRGVR